MNKIFAALMMTGTLAFAPVQPAHALFGSGIVYDPTNHAENLLTAARSLEQINNQIAQLQNQARMLAGQARNLANLPYSSLSRLQASVQETQRLLGEAQRIAHDVAAIDAAFTRDYGAAAARGDFDARIGGARQRWETSIAGFQDALKVQAGVVGNIDAARTKCRRSSAAARPRPAPCRPPRQAISCSPCKASKWRISPPRLQRRTGPKRWKRPAPPRPKLKAGRTLPASSITGPVMSRPRLPCSVRPRAMLPAETVLKGIAFAIGAVAALMAAGDLHRTPRTDPLPETITATDPVRQTLRRCRTLTRQEFGTDTACWATWAQQRRRFLGLPADDREGE